MKKICMAALAAVSLLLAPGLLRAEESFESFYSANRGSMSVASPLLQTDQTASADNSSFFFDFDLGTAHKIVGYSALAFGAAAGATGYLVERKYDAGKEPSGALKSFHSASAAGSIGLGISAAATGFLAYSDMIDFGQGITRYNTHMVLGTISALGFLASALLAPKEKAENVRVHPLTAGSAPRRV